MLRLENMSICAASNNVIVIEADKHNLLIAKDNEIRPDNACHDVNASRDDNQDFSGSQDIFSDDEQVKNATAYFSPKIPLLVNNTSNTSVISLKTPTLPRNIEETPGKAKVPKTPADLLPFITKSNIMWASDMETPESKVQMETNSCDKTVNSVTVSSTRPPKTPNSKSTTPKIEIVTSPVLGGKKRYRKCAKRRLLCSVTTELDVDQQSSISSNSDKVSSEIADSMVNEPVVNNKRESIRKDCGSPLIINPDLNQNEQSKLESTPKKVNSPPKINSNSDQNKVFENPPAQEKNSNTSTQEFFINASFSSIDRLCSNVIQEEKLSLSKKLESQIKGVDDVIKEENEDVDDNALERVAAIKRSQKPVKRSTDISYTIIPKEVFTSSLRKLEAANKKFHSEKKETKSQPVKLSSSFVQFSELKNQLLQKDDVIKKEPLHHYNDAVPPEFIDDWNALDPKINNIKAIKQEKSDNKSVVNINIAQATSCLMIINNYGNINSDHCVFQNKSSDVDTLPEKDTQFSTARGKGISVSEDSLLNFEKIYHDIENENLDETAFIGLKKNKLSRLQNNGSVKKTFQSFIPSVNNSSTVNTHTVNLSKAKAEKFKELELQEFLQLKSSPQNSEIADGGFSTANGKNITVSEEKEKYYSNVYNELGNVDENSLSSEKLKRSLQLKNTKKPMGKAAVVLNKTNDTFNADVNSVVKNIEKIPNVKTENDGFSTAGGKKIDVNNEKENYYSSVYKELGDVDENSLNSLKTKKRRSLSLIKKPSDQAITVLNKINQSHCAINSSIINEKQIEIFDTQTTASFSTAGGKKIDVNDEKENYYSNVYKELGEVDENSLISFKKKKLQVQSIQKPMDKAVVVFNKSANDSMQPSTLSTTSSSIKVFDMQSSSDGFSTAGGKNISVNPEKVEFFSKMYDQLSQEINDEDSLLHANNKKLSKLSSNKKHITKPSTVANQYQKSIQNVKLSINNDTDDVFYNVDLDKLMKIDCLKTEIVNDNCFVVPNSLNISKKTNHLGSLPKSRIIKEENLTNVDESTTKINDSMAKSAKNQLGMLKRKLEDCEQKKPERCRSFGGISEAERNENSNMDKFNKSDPTFANQPLQQGITVSQCFDPHSDSWLSKIEISHLNNDKVKSPDVRTEKSRVEKNVPLSDDCRSRVSNDLRGFSFKDIAVSFRRYSIFENFLKKQQAKYDNCTDLYVYSGETISITNRTTSKQHIFVQSANNLNIKKNTDELSSYVLIDASPKKIIKKLEVVKNIVNDKGREKRKITYIDSNTPLTTFKKPRIGLELTGKRLFSDESSADERNDKSIELAHDQRTIANTTEAQVEIEDVDLTEERCRAIQQQKNLIKAKKQKKVKPVMGSLLRERLENSKNRKSWSDLVGSLTPVSRSPEHIKLNHPDGKLLEITASNAASYKFMSSNIIRNQKVVNIDAGDGACLIFDEYGHAGVKEFTSAFLTMPGVDPKLIPAGWIENHYRWIVWKLASMDRIRFDSICFPKVLKPERVMQELKYRYDREIDKAERPALRRILEKDDVSTRRMVLCISLIEERSPSDAAEKEARIKLGLPHWRVEATDGWYSIPLTLDNAMSSYIFSGKIKEGTKIITYGAELLECERGFYPLEKPANVSLKVYANCTRRARWDTKLGFQSSSRPIPVKLKTLSPNGGLVGQVTVVAARVYPLLYREKTVNGQSIYRNAKSEEKAVTDHEKACELKVHAMYAEAQKNFDSKKKSDSDEEFELSQLNSGSQPKIRSYNQIERKQERIKQKMESKLREDLPPPRQVTPVLKVRLVDDRSTAMLSIWGANEDSCNNIKEGSTITIYNAFTSGFRASEICLTANRFTHIETETLLKLPYPVRKCTLIPDITSSLFEPKFNEFDTIGIVVSSESAPYGMKNFDVANLVYPTSNNESSSFLSILFWGGINSYGYQKLLMPGTIVACSNLEYRRNNAWSIAVAYCSEKSVFTSNPRQSYLLKEIRNLRDVIQNPLIYAESCVSEIQAELSKKLKPRSNQGTPTNSFHGTSFHNNSSLLGTPDSPAGLTNQRRLEILSQYGSVSDISSSIVLNNSSSRVKKDFTPVTPRSNVR